MAALTKRWFDSWVLRHKSQLDEYGLMWRALRRDWLSLISLGIVLLTILAVILAPYLTPYPEQGLGEPNLPEKLAPPSRAHPLGTDHMGRDMLARVLFGGRSALTLGFMVVFIAVIIGLITGSVAGFFGGWVDEVIMRLTDVFLSFPPLLLAIAVATALGPSFINSIIAIAVTWWPWYTRLVRAQTLSARERAFIEAARGIGVRSPIIIARHVIPNVLTPLLVTATIDIGQALIIGSIISFLGLGVQPPTADWGKMVADGRRFLLLAPWYSTYPGLAIFLVALSMNLLGDGIRDVLDPRTRRLG